MPILNNLRPQHSQGTNRITKAEWEAKIANGEITDQTTTMYQIMDDNEFTTIDSIVDEVASRVLSDKLIDDTSEKVVEKLTEEGGFADTFMDEVSANFPNDNLLDNPDFKINQRNITQVISSGETTNKLAVDRWTLGGSGIFNVADEYVEITKTAEDEYYNLQQECKGHPFKAGELISFSAKLSGDAIVVIGGRIAADDNILWFKQVYSTGSGQDEIVSGTVEVPQNIEYLLFVVQANTINSAVKVYWTKAEASPVVTAFIAPNYNKELLKIQSMNDDGSSKLISNTTMPTIMNSQMVSNPNLFDNPDFKINQRGQTSYTGTTRRVCVDRWMLYYDLTAEPTTEGIKVTNVVGNANMAWLIQIIDPAALVTGAYTLTTCIRKSRADMPLRVANTFTKNNTDWQIVSGRVDIDTSTLTSGVGQWVHAATTDDSGLAGDYVEIKWTKLELGTQATVFTPPNPLTELLKCQRYYCEGYATFKMSQAYVDAYHLSIPYVKFPVTMRIQPTIKLYSVIGTPNTLTTWTIGTDSIYNYCEANTELYDSKNGFDSIRAIGGYSSPSVFSVTDPETYTFKYIASAEI